MRKCYIYISICPLAVEAILEISHGLTHPDVVWTDKRVLCLSPIAACLPALVLKTLNGVDCMTAWKTKIFALVFDT